jgi:putative aldouronate transport system permease protein
MMAPVLLYFLVFCYLPMFGIIIAFQKYSPIRGFWASPWVGWRNFSLLFSSTDFPMVMRNTILISLYRLFWGFPAPIILALLLNEVKSKFFKKTAQTISYMPHFLSWVITAGLVTTTLELKGPLNQFFGLFGMEPRMFILEAKLFRSILIVSGVWKGVGWGTLIYLAAIAGVDPELYEAAIIDGAGRFRQALHITLPAIQSTIIILLILRVGTILNAGFEDILLLQNSMVRDVSEVIDTHVYKIGIQGGNFSFGTAVGLFKSTVGFVLVVITDRIAKRFGDTSLL